MLDGSLPMPIWTICPSCQHAGNAPDKLVGKTIT
jgi:hypothetical protein